MKINPVIMVIGLAGLAIVGVVGWYLASPLFINKTIDEGFPVAAAATEREVAAAMPDEKVSEAMPADQPTVIGQGQFKDADSFHKGSGSVALYQLPDGSHVLRFEEFSVTNGPDLHVLLIQHPAPTSSADLGEYLDLGSLKGNIGSQNYEIPAGTDLSQYKSVVIYCQPFHVVFATAEILSGDSHLK